MREWDTLDNPFVGLRPFESEDSLHYFGRRDHVRALLHKLHLSRFLTVIGSSGCGKSSLVRAGLIPNLEAGFLVQDRDIWCVCRMKPGDAPLYNLARNLVVALKGESEPEATENLAERFCAMGVQAALQLIRPKLDKLNANLFLLVDQFEEIFRYALEDEGYAVATDFVAIILRLAEQVSAPVYVCMTMRSDFIGDCDNFFGLPEAMNRGQYLVPRLTRRQRREAIVGPIHLSGAKMTSRLIDRLLNEDVGTRDDLPILQHALMLTWAEWIKTQQGPIDLQHYEKIHTVKGALSYHAEEALAELKEDEPELAKLIFQTVTDTDSGNRRIRRPCHLSEIEAVSKVPVAKIMPVIRKFQKDGRLFIVLAAQEAEDDPLVDISHESLIRQWHTLTNWVDEEAGSAKIYRRLADTAELHQKGKAGLYREADLHVTVEWLKTRKPNEAWAKRYHDNYDNAMKFLDESQAAYEAAIRKETEQRQEKERLLREKAAQQRKALQLTRIIILVITVFLVIATGVAWYAFDRRSEAIRQTQNANLTLAKAFEAKAKEALKDGEENRNTQAYRQVWLYAAAALSQEIPAEKSALSPEMVGLLFSSPAEKYAFAEKWVSPKIYLPTTTSRNIAGVAFSPDGKALVSVGESFNIQLWDVATGMATTTIDGYGQLITSFAYSPDGTILATGTKTGIIRLSSLPDGREIAVLEGHLGNVNSMAFSPNGKILVSGSEDTTIRIWEVPGGVELAMLEGHSDSIESVAFNPEGKIVASGSKDTTIRLWSIFDRKPLALLKGHTDRVESLAFSSNGEFLASASADSSVRLWEVAGETQKKVLWIEAEGVNCVAFSSKDNNMLASGAKDGTIRLWEAMTGKIRAVLEGHTKAVISIDFSPDDSTLASWAEDGLIRLWEVPSPLETAMPVGNITKIESIAFSPDGKLLGSGLRTGAIHLMDVTNYSEFKVIKGHSGWIASLAFSPDGKTLASGSGDTTIRLWEVGGSSKKEKMTFDGHSGWVTSLAFHPDGKMMASGGRDSTVMLWETSSRIAKKVLKEHTSSVTSVAFSPNGKWLASGSNDSTIRLWEVASRNEKAILRGHTGGVNCVVFSPQGDFLASGGQDKSVRLWKVPGGKQTEVLKGHTNGVKSIAFSPKDRILASGEENSTIRLWNLSTGRELALLTTSMGNVNSVAFSPNGRMLASAVEDSPLRLWDLSLYPLYIANEKDRLVWQTFFQALGFLWQYELDGLSIKYQKRKTILTPKDGYYFDYDEQFRPLLNPPASGQTKLQQAFQWALENKRSTGLDIK